MGSPDITIRFGASVRSLRRGLGISQEELAGRAELHRTYIAGIEGGARNITLRSIDKLARALGVSTATLLSHTNDPGDLSSGGFADILLVEDNPDDVDLTLRAFREAKIANRVHVISDGTEALDYLFCTGSHSERRRKEPPHVILLDLNLPKISGLEVLRRIKSDPRTRAIPVIVLTMSRKNQDIIESRRLGAHNYIVKPVDFQNFSQVTPQLEFHWALLKPTTRLTA